MISIFLLTIGIARSDVLPRHAPEPPDNRSSPRKIELGKELFFDPRVAKSGRTSCLSCHNIMAGGDDGFSTSPLSSGRPSSRSAPTVWNAAFMSTLFWYGEAASLEDQVEGPLEDLGGGDAQVVVDRIARIPGYAKQFEKVFGSGPVTLSLVAKAIAAFERTLITPDSRYDRFMRGEESALSPLEKNGLEIFNRVGCVKCHGGVNFAGPSLPQGRGWFQTFPIKVIPELEDQYHFSDDQGRFNVTGLEKDRHVFRVPTLRNVALTAPYFHNGSVPTLIDAVRVMARTQLSTVLSDSEARALTAFLGSLTGRFPPIQSPRLPVTSGQSLNGP